MSIDYSIENQVKIMTMKKGTTIKDIEKPSLDGYEFLYWEVDGNKVDDDFEINSNVVLKAVWEKIDTSDNDKYTITFYSKNNVINKILVDKEGTINEPSAPSDEWCQFTGWYLDKEMTKPYNFSSKVMSDLNLYAGWNYCTGNIDF